MHLNASFILKMHLKDTFFSKGRIDSKFCNTNIFSRDHMANCVYLSRVDSVQSIENIIPK